MGDEHHEPTAPAPCQPAGQIDPDDTSVLVQIRGVCANGSEFTFSVFAVDPSDVENVRRTVTEFYFRNPADPDPTYYSRPDGTVVLTEEYRGRFERYGRLLAAMEAGRVKLEPPWSEYIRAMLNFSLEWKRILVDSFQAPIPPRATQGCDGRRFLAGQPSDALGTEWRREVFGYHWYSLPAHLHIMER